MVAKLISIQATAFLISLFVFIAAFIFEILSIVLLDRIGLEERELNSSGMIMRTYGLMGVGAAVGFWLLGFMSSIVESSILLLIASFIFLKINVMKRNDHTIKDEKKVSLPFNLDS